MIFVDGKDIGYKEKSNWWSDLTDPDCFRISTSKDYPDEYFKQDHVGEEVIKNYCDNVEVYFKLLSGRNLKSIVEFGSGGGWFTKEFYDRGYEINGYESSYAGNASCQAKSLFNVRGADFRIIMAPTKRYDIALCTEVAGHIEPPFSAILVNNLIQYSDLVWWSSEVPGFTKPHLHHPNEQNYRYWINIFEFYNYGAYFLPDAVYDACEGRGRYIFYNKNVYKR